MFISSHSHNQLNYAISSGVSTYNPAELRTATCNDVGPPSITALRIYRPSLHPSVLSRSSLYCASSSSYALTPPAPTAFALYLTALPAGSQ